MDYVSRLQICSECIIHRTLPKNPNSWASLWANAHSAQKPTRFIEEMILDQNPSCRQSHSAQTRQEFLCHH